MTKISNPFLRIIIHVPLYLLVYTSPPRVYLLDVRYRCYPHFCSGLPLHFGDRCVSLMVPLIVCPVHNRWSLGLATHVREPLGESVVHAPPYKMAALCAVTQSTAVISGCTLIVTMASKGRFRCRKLIPAFVTQPALLAPSDLISFCQGPLSSIQSSLCTAY